MQNAKCPYFIMSLIFGGLGVVFGLALIPSISLLAAHIYVQHIKATLAEKSVVNKLFDRIETIERRMTFK